MPEVASVPENVTASGWLYHPFLSAGRAGVAVTTGAVLSILNTRLLLAVEVPSRERGSWVVRDDGTMQTTYRLHPGVTWHDGTALDAEDFVLGHRSRAAKLAWGQTQPNAETQAIENVHAEDSRTVSPSMTDRVRATASSFRASAACVFVGYSE